MTRPRPGRAAVLAAATAALALAGEASAQEWRTVTMSRQLDGGGALHVVVKYGAGRFRVRPTGDGSLYRMNLRYDEEVYQPVADYESGRLRLGVEGLGKRIRVGRDDDHGELDLELATGVPMELELDFGAVRADLDLGGLSLTDLQLRTGASESRVDVSEPNPLELGRAKLEVGAADFSARRLANLNAKVIEVSAGVGEVTLDLTGEWRRDARLDVHMGLGSLQLVFPEGLGVKLVKRSFLTSLDSQGLVKRGDAYYSTDWESAPRKLTVDVEAAFGSIDVRWVR